MYGEDVKSYAFLTGATGGLGKAFAVACASRGWNLFLTDLRSESLEFLSSAISRIYGVEVLTFACDLTDSSERDVLLRELRSRRIVLRAIINVAGGDTEGPVARVEPDSILRIIRLNIEATVGITRGLLELRDPEVICRIIFVSSLAAFFPMPVKATYAASKRFLLDFAVALGDELRGERTTVTALCPAGLPTIPSCIEAIEAQNFAGLVTTVNIGRAASYALDKACTGARIVIPGLVNRLLPFAARFVPRRVLAWLIGRRWRAAHQRRMQSGRSDSASIPRSSDV